MVGCRQGRAQRASMLRQYFAVAALDHVSSTPVLAAFRATGKPAKEKGALAAWMRRGELLAEQEGAPGPFNAPQFRSALEQTRRLTTSPPQEAVPAVQELWRGWRSAPLCPGTAWGGRKLALAGSHQITPWYRSTCAGSGPTSSGSPSFTKLITAPASSQEGLRPRLRRRRRGRCRGFRSRPSHRPG